MDAKNLTIEVSSQANGYAAAIAAASIIKIYPEGLVVKIIEAKNPKVVLQDGRFIILLTAGVNVVVVL
ncbi:hypothetical protein NEOLI_005350 [Neolecta irregularis DAH-3]|uniref:Uncharacterized protein n=1 Tax=Neolecta irregularis (strain DAH-3) TaxID=1198029 RepID=A0A1U7LJY8_NEOID|nr:hypothetical protein NEOLI_005350 [Neolecta irregularis DAH-3]|eukprot:OLL22970.1 hypothetical protein NEOLI_005350 [Neolecta irregularis DAH-3]